MSDYADMWDGEFFPHPEPVEVPQERSLLHEEPEEELELPSYTEGEEEAFWDAWWADDSLMCVDWPDPEPVQFDYSYRRPGWPRLS
jgi:hypothetical protein